MRNSKQCLSIALILIISWLAEGCISQLTVAQMTGLTNEELNLIPKMAKVVITETDMKQDSAFEVVMNILIARGHRIQKDDKARGYINTEGKDVGNGTYQRMSITFNGAVVRIETECNACTTESLKSVIIY